MDVSAMSESSLLGYQAELAFLLANPDEDTEIDRTEIAREYGKVRRELNKIQLDYDDYDDYKYYDD